MSVHDLSAADMRVVGLFTVSAISQVLVVLGLYAFVLAGKLGESGETRDLRAAMHKIKPNADF
jgi:hypothetical protein